MNIVITGHTKNLGKFLFDHFSKEHKTIGLSRSNGFSLPEKYQEVYSIAKSCDIFVNSAYVGDIQSRFIVDLHSHTKIITCGSMGADYAGNGNPYFDYKKHLEDHHKQFVKKPNKGMLLLKMGYLENYPNRFPIPYSTVVNAIELWIQNPRITMVEFENDFRLF